MVSSPRIIELLRHVELFDEECRTLIGLLYDQRNGSTEQEFMIKAVAEKKVAIGMSRIELVYSLGNPQDVNTTTTANVVHEQWVYSLSTYVYTENGYVTSYQN